MRMEFLEEHQDKREKNFMSVQNTICIAQLTIMQQGNHRNHE